MHMIAAAKWSHNSRGVQAISDSNKEEDDPHQQRLVSKKNKPNQQEPTHLILAQQVNLWIRELPIMMDCPLKKSKKELQR